MKRLFKITHLLAAFLLTGALASAQNVSDLILSEVVSVPDEAGLVDEYGLREGWVEVFNTSQGTVNIAGCFLTDDVNNLTKSQIPKGDNRTKIGPRQSVVFFGSGNNGKGTFHLNFAINGGTTLYLVSNDGRTIVNTIEVPANIPVGQSYGKKAIDLKEMKFDQLGFMQPSPYVKNGNANAKTKAQKMAETDPHGFILSVTAVSVVFSALIILFLIYSLSGAFFSGKFKKEPKPKKAAPVKAGDVSPEVAAAIAMAMDKEFGSEVYAAIGLALHDYLTTSAHDQESFIITIKPSEQTGWSNKSLTFRKRP